MTSFSVVATIALGALSVASCRLDSPCFGTDECEGNQICFQGECIAPPDPVPVDTGVAIDAGVDAGGVTGEVTWVRDIEPIVRVRCQPCHTQPPANGAPFSLLTYNSTQLVGTGGAPIYERMAIRVQDTNNPMPPATQPRLSALEIELLAAWAQQDAPLGMIPDSGIPDSGPPADTGPDAGFPDTGFFDGGSNGATDPIPLAEVNGLTQLQGNYSNLDGVAWSAEAGVFYFALVSSNLIFEYNPANNAAGLFLPNTLGASGVGIDPETDRLILAERTGRRVVRVTDDNPPETTAIANAFMNDRFNAPNDVEVRSDGVIYFTDPPVDLQGRRELPFNGLFRIDTDGEVTVEWGGGPDSTEPNGLALSPDESLLYMSDSQTGIIRVFDVLADGALANARGFTVTAEPTAGGMDTDRDGNLYVTSEEGIEVYAPSGFKWGNLAVPDLPTNLAFGGENLDVLLVPGLNGLYFYQVGIPGAVRPLGAASPSGRRVNLDAGVSH